jgi:hypothetical protein
LPQLQATSTTSTTSTTSQGTQTDLATPQAASTAEMEVQVDLPVDQAAATAAARATPVSMTERGTPAMALDASSDGCSEASSEAGDDLRKEEVSSSGGAESTEVTISALRKVCVG